MPRKPKMLVLAVLVLAMVVGASGMALAGSNGRGWGRGGVRAESVLTKADAIEALGLTDDQVARIQAMILAQHQLNLQWQATLAQRRLELRQMLWQRTPNREAIQAKLAEIETLRQQHREQLKGLETLQDILTEDQWEQWRESQRGWRRNCKGRDR